MSNSKKYWKSLEQLDNNSEIEKLAHNEFIEELPLDEFISDDNISNTTTSRRDFLKFLGFTTAAATLAACETPVTRSIPYVVKPEEITPGIANYYATSLFDGFDSANVLVKTREGRPIKIQNNKLSKYNGHANARVNASVLSLYDSKRIQGPTINGEDASWDTFNTNIKAQLNSLKALNQTVVLLTSTIASPTTTKIINSLIS